VRREVHTLALVARDARTPWYAKLIAALAVGYGFSPIQLIPSFIPVLGLLDDVVILSAGMRVALWLTPPGALSACRERAAVVAEDRERALVGESCSSSAWSGS
jgi:uncharacterized membrane protein YkvA (DUF1232 family)